MRPMDIPAFDGFPYIATRFVSGYHHVILIPKEMELASKWDFAVRQATANKLLTFLVLDHDACVCIWPDGSQSLSQAIPRGTFIVADKLKTPIPVPSNAELCQRAAALQEFQERHPIDGYLFGDLTKGGRVANHDDWKRLNGTWAGGVPRRLFQCDLCGEWRGECLDPKPVYLGKITRGVRTSDGQEIGTVECDPDLIRFGSVVWVHCRCQNDNLCASCGQPLAAWKLNANYYRRADGRVIHVPAFGALAHQCPNSLNAARSD